MSSWCDPHRRPPGSPAHGRTRSGGTGRKYLVGYVGVMGLQDGLDYLVDAARMIIADWWRQDIQFVLVGSGPELPAAS